MESLGGVEPASRTLRWYRDGRELSPEETLSDGVVAVAAVSRKQDLTGVEVSFMAAHSPAAPEPPSAPGRPSTPRSKSTP